MVPVQSPAVYHFCPPHHTPLCRVSVHHPPLQLPNQIEHEGFHISHPTLFPGVMAVVMEQTTLATLLLLIGGLKTA